MWPFRTYVGLIEVVQALTVEAVFFSWGHRSIFHPKSDRSSTNFGAFASNTRKIAAQTAIRRLVQGHLSFIDLQNV